MLYNFFRLVIYIPLVFVYIFNSKKREFLKKRFFQDFSFLKNEKEYIWIHCSSVGEVNLSDSLIKKILEKKSESILLSVFTDTGFETAEKKYSTNDRIKIIYFPLDDYFLIKTILKNIRLKTLIVIETEIWPNLINLCSKVGKVILANGRISDKSFKRDKKIGFILKSLLSEKIDFFCVQTEIDKERLIELGAKKDRVEVTGNLKFDIELENFSEESKEHLKNQIYYNGKKILDDYFLIKTILKNIRLKTLIVIETEIWPNLINLCSKVGKVILANGRISDKSFKRDKKIGFILKSLLGEKIDFFCVQTEIDKERFIELGAKKDRVKVTGNLKFDIELENFSEESKENLKNEIYYNKKKIFVCGSTRTGEDEILIESFKKLENYLLVLVPRHLDRIPKLEEVIKSQGLTYKKYSELEEGDYKVLIVDKMGVLRKFYSIADVTFVGGTLVNIGGHSLLEPLFYRKTPIFGKYLQNVKDISKEVLKREIGTFVGGTLVNIGGHSLLEPLFYRKTPIFGKYLQNVKDISKEVLKREIGYLAENSEEIYENILKIEKNDLDSKKIEDFFRENQNVAEKILEKI